MAAGTASSETDARDTVRRLLPCRSGTRSPPPCWRAVSRTPPPSRSTGPLSAPSILRPQPAAPHASPEISPVKTGDPPPPLRHACPGTKTACLCGQARDAWPDRQMAPALIFPVMERVRDAKKLRSCSSRR